MGKNAECIQDACKDAGLPKPEYGTDGLFVWITFLRDGWEIDAEFFNEVFLQ